MYRHRCGCSEANAEIIKGLKCYNGPSCVQITACDSISRLYQRQLWSACRFLGGVGRCSWWSAGIHSADYRFLWGVQLCDE